MAGCRPCFGIDSRTMSAQGSHATAPMLAMMTSATITTIRQPAAPGCNPAWARAPAATPAAHRHFSAPTASPAARRCWRTFSAPTWNPQNTDQPRVLPSPDFSAEEAVCVQLDALAVCDDPWPSHGIHLAYEFGYDIGGMDPSMYFGFPKDLYHLDHFGGFFQNKLPELVSSTAYEILEVKETQMDKEEEEWQVLAVVTPGGAPGQAPVRFRFHLRRKKVGARKGALMTAMIKREEA
jgi:hypothetical protein